MDNLYILRGGNGVAYFRSRREAQRAASAIPVNWGRDVPGGRNVHIEEARIFDSAEEWDSYKTS